MRNVTEMTRILYTLRRLRLRLTRAVSSRRPRHQEIASDSPGDTRRRLRLARGRSDRGLCSLAEGKLVFWNHAAERILGLPAAQVLGRRCDEIIVETADTDAYSSWNGSEGRYAGCISRPVTALMLCGSGDHRQIVLTPIVVADRPGGDALALYVFDEPSGIQPVGPDGQGVPERSPEPQSGPVPTPAGHATSSPSPHGLTRREIEILRLVALAPQPIRSPPTSGSASTPSGTTSAACAASSTPGPSSTPSSPRCDTACCSYTGGGRSPGSCEPWSRSSPATRPSPRAGAR